LRKGYKQLDSKKQLKKVMEGKITYHYLPMLYNGGFVDVMLIEKAKKISNNFYLSMTPDVYSAIVFSLLTDNYIYSFEPFAIDAASKHSTGASYLFNSDIKNDYSPSGKFLSENNIPFHKELPLIDNGKPPKSLEAIVYEAYLQASPFIQHQKMNFCVNHEQQLEVILKNSFFTSSDSYENAIIWGKKFAELHNLDYDKILSKSLKFIIIDKFKKYIIKALMALRFSYVIQGDSTIPIKNVFEASIIASTIKKVKPRNIFFKALSRGILRIIK